MTADVPILISHLETYLGQIQAGAPLSEGIQGVVFPDQPVTGATAFTTLGLSNHLLAQERGPRARLEFLFACRDAHLDQFEPLSVLADVTDQALAAHAAPPRGTVIGPGGPFFAGSQMEALYCTGPVYFQDGLSTFAGFAEPFLIVWLVPIAPIEAAFVQSHGWSRFETLLTEAQPDLLDMLRPAIVDHA